MHSSFLLDELVETGSHALTMTIDMSWKKASAMCTKNECGAKMTLNSDSQKFGSDGEF